MFRKLWSVGFAVVLAVISFGTVCAEKGGVGVSLKAGTLGIGGVLTVGLAPKVNIRVTVNGFSYTYNTTQDDIRYAFDLSLLSAMSLLDLHPTGGGFRLSGGVMMNKNLIDSRSQPSVAYAIGNTSYTPAEVGTLAGKLEFRTLAPYAGLGWGNAVGEDKKLGFSFDAGLAFQGSPKVSMIAVGGLLATNTDFLADLEREERNLEDDISSFKYFPVITLGLSTGLSKAET